MGHRIRSSPATYEPRLWAERFKRIKRFKRIERITLPLADSWDHWLARIAGAGPVSALHSELAWATDTFFVGVFAETARAGLYKILDHSNFCLAR
jgi:hypothetical protein